MIRGRFPLVLLTLLVASSLAKSAGEPLYDEKADARKQIASAIAAASKSGKNIVLIFGANWCFDCRTLDEQMHKGELASLIEKSYVVVKIDVGRMNKNLDVATKYGVPVKNGIPAVAVLDRRGKLLYAQDQGQFVDARHMPYESFKAFFEHWKPKVRSCRWLPSLWRLFSQDVVGADAAQDKGFTRNLIGDAIGKRHAGFPDVVRAFHLFGV